MKRTIENLKIYFDRKGDQVTAHVSYINAKGLTIEIEETYNNIPITYGGGAHVDKEATAEAHKQIMLQASDEMKQLIKDLL